MAGTNFSQAAIVAKAKEFSQKPENLLLAIVYNNPDQVTQNLQSMAGVSYAMDAEQIMDWFEDYGGQLDVETLYNILDVPFDPQANNITIEYEPVLQYQGEILYGDTVNDPLRSWAEYFPEGIELLYEKYFKGQQATGEIGSDIDENIGQKQAAVSKAMNRRQRNGRIWKTAAFVLNVLILLTFLGFLIAGIVAISKNGKKIPVAA